MSKQKAIILRVDEDFKERLDAMVEREAVNLSALIRNFLENWLKEKEAEHMINLEAYFCEYETTHEVNGETITGCITYPVTITNQHAMSSRGQPVVIIDGEAYGPGDLPPGELQIPAGVYNKVAPRLRQLGYQVCGAPVDEDWLKDWEKGIELDDHWHPEARLVQF